MDVPIGFDADRQHRGDGPFDHFEDRSVDGVPALRGLEIPRSSKRNGARRCSHIVLRNKHSRHQAGYLAGLRRVLNVHFDFPLCGANRADGQQIRYGKDRVPLAPLGIHRVDKLITALPLISDLKGLLLGEGRVNKEAHGASGLEHGTVACVLWQKWALGLAARSQTNPGSVRVRKEPYFHLRSIAPSSARLGLTYRPTAGFSSGYYLTLFIHVRIGPLTLLSAVLGDITPEMWLWSLYTT